MYQYVLMFLDKIEKNKDILFLSYLNKFYHYHKENTYQ